MQFPSLSLTNPSAADSGLYGPVSSGGLTGEFNFGFKNDPVSGGMFGNIRLEHIALIGFFAWLLLSKR